MELEGLKRCLATARRDGITIASLTTDRHPSVQKHMRLFEKEIDHFYDIWHMSKCKFNNM